MSTPICFATKVLRQFSGNFNSDLHRHAYSCSIFVCVYFFFLIGFWHMNPSGKKHKIMPVIYIKAIGLALSLEVPWHP